MEEWDGVVLRAGVPDKNFNVFTEEALAAHDGETVPLTLELGGPIIGKAVLKYVPGEKVLKAEYSVSDPNLAEFLRGSPPNIFE
jgi:hypothetical protein